MFEIEYKGGNGLVINAKKQTAYIDAKLSVVGLSDLMVRDGIEIATEARFLTNGKDAKIVIEGPGEYEVGPFSVRGVAAVRHIDEPNSQKLSTMYRLEVEDVRIAILGNIAPKLDEDQQEELGIIDILVIPIGGNGYTLDATSAATLVRDMEPKAVIPVSYADDGLKYEVPQEALETFVTELGAPLETVSKYKVKSASALPAVMTVVQVTRS